MLTLKEKSNFHDYNRSSYSEAINFALMVASQKEDSNEPLYVVFRLSSGWGIVQNLPSQGCTAVYPDGRTEILEYCFIQNAHKIGIPIPDGTLLAEE